MPKIIENLKKEIIEKGEQLLQRDGYQALTMRQVAKECQIALGTIYNYYSSKEELVAHIMLNHWSEYMCQASSDMTRADTCMDGLRMMYEYIRQFCEQYRSVWGESSGKSMITAQRHQMLIQHIAKPTKELVDRFGCHMENLDTFLAELLLNSASNQYHSFDEIQPFIQKLLQ